MFARVMLFAAIFALLGAAWAGPQGDPTIRVDESVVRIVPLMNLDVKLLVDNLQGAMQDFLPAGVQRVLGLTERNALLVKAADTKAMSEFEAFIKTIDLPIPQVVVEVTLVETRASDLQAFGAKWEPATGSTGLCYLSNVRATLDTLMARKSARQIATTRVLVPSGGHAAITLGEAGLTVQALEVAAVTAHPDSSVTMQVNPIFYQPQVHVTPGIVRAANGQTLLLGGFTNRRDISNTNAANPAGAPATRDGDSTAAASEIMVYVTPRLVKLEQTEANPAPFATPAPLW